MNEIKLLVEDKNITLVLAILDNLKEGLISDIQSNTETKKPPKTTRYQPKVNTIVKEEDSGTADTSGKYMNPASYKRRMKK
ncbi:MAG: hypothetical protein ACI9TV_000324 [Sulfurimonas sp.]|jgi:hypothetical protein|uniref:hypothetical protein n=1 Tax=Sulfurimonas sp. TaxID=2022749 RepID=UPI0039E5DF3D